MLGLRKELGGIWSIFWICHISRNLWIKMKQQKYIKITAKYDKTASSYTNEGECYRI